MMDKEYRCAQDVREEELLKEGYVKADKVFFRIGRAIFVVDTLEKDYSEKEALETPVGVVAKLNNPRAEFDNESLKMLQEMFDSTGFLRIAIEGDPDGGISFGISSEVLLTGYRYGLDDVIVDGKLLVTTHNSWEDIMRNFADELYGKASWIHVPDWDTYDGTGYSVASSKEIEDEVKRVAGGVRELAYKLEHLDDMPDWVKEKFGGE